MNEFHVLLPYCLEVENTRCFMQTLVKYVRLVCLSRVPFVTVAGGSPLRTYLLGRRLQGIMTCPILHFFAWF